MSVANVTIDPCRDCGKPICYATDYYMVHDRLWCRAFKIKLERYPDGSNNCPAGMLHIKCLEKRLGRKLRQRDFPDFPVNNGIFGFHRNAFPA